LLFLGISYALWLSVSLRWIMEFMEHTHPLTPLVGGLLLLYGVLLGLEPLLTGAAAVRGHLYLLVQLALVVAALLLFYELDFFAILLLPLAGQASFIFPRRSAATWVAILLLANFLGQLHQFGWPGALPFVFLYTAAILFVAAYSLMTIRSEASRRRSEGLLAELQDAHRQLQAYAGQAEELAVARERNRLARELHDSVAQTLYGLTLQAEAASRKLAAGKLEQVADDLHFFRTSTQQTLQETRLLIFELRPPILDELGLVAALRARLDAVEGRSGIACQVELAEIERLPPRVETALYRITQEALNNILKHAGAARVTLDLRQQAGKIRLEIGDDGCGFDPQAAQQGYGLQGMQERAEQLGGSWKLSSAPGEGTRITVEVPYE
jgi:signal transduction histidine kinase